MQQGERRQSGPLETVQTRVESLYLMGIKASSQRNESHLPMAKGRMLIEQMELCEGEDAKTTLNL